MGRPSLREKLLNAGVRLLHQRGYEACGVREITAAAGAPLGSFTNHFRSKEEFAALVLDRYFAALQEVVDATLRDRSREPLERIAAYFDAIGRIADPIQWRWGCLIVNMGLELPQHSELLRIRLEQVLAALTAPFVEAITEAQQGGQARTDIAAERLAEVVLAGWHGTLLRAKVEQGGGSALTFAATTLLLLRK